MDSIGFDEAVRPSPQQTDGRISKHSRPRRETETKAATKTARIGPSPPLFLPLPPLLGRHFATLHNYLQCHFVSEAVVYFLRYLSMVRDKNNCCGAKICQGHPTTRIQAQFVPRAAPALSRKLAPIPPPLRPRHGSSTFITMTTDDGDENGPRFGGDGESGRARSA